VGALVDPRLTRRHRIAAAVTALFVLWGVLGLGPGHWGDLFGHIRLHVFVVAWLLLVTLRTRTVGWREVARFWVIGLFPVVLVVYALTEPAETLFGAGTFQTAFFVPLVEETVKALPLVVWVLVSMRKQVTPTVSDLMVLGFALGAGFAFHEDGLWQRLAADGFGAAPWGVLFPTFLYKGQFVVTHSGWTMLVGMGVGVWAVHRDRVWSWAVPPVVLVLVVIDHGAANARSGIAEILPTLVLHGHLTAWLLLLGVLLVVGHDVLMLRWAHSRDRRFAHPTVREDLAVLGGGIRPESVGRLFARLRYRRARNAAFTDLYRARSRGRSAGDRRAVVAWLRQLEVDAEVAGT
jgi:RsiW-degrading membrane proteinase PrsW (M82 family)